jgi:hypothetical protein
MSSGSSMFAITRSRPWQRPQVSISIANTRFRRCAQLIATCFGTAGASASCLAPFPPAPRTAGVIAARKRLCGANPFIITFANSYVVGLSERRTYGVTARYRF